MNATVWWESKQLWGAFIIFVATLAQAKWGFVIDPQIQGYLVSAFIILIRLLTKGPITTAKPADPVKEAEVYAAQAEETATQAVEAAVNAEANVKELKQ